MKNKLITHLIIIACLLHISSGYSANNVHSEVFTFPTQPYLAYDVTQSSINPFEMTSFSIGKTYARYHGNFSQAFTEHKWLNSLKNHNYELKLETPFYQLNRSLGLEWSGFYDAISFDPWKQMKNIDFNHLQESLINRYLMQIKPSKRNKNLNTTEINTPQEQDDLKDGLQWISGFSMLGTFKFKFPFHTNIGHFAVTMTPKAGFVGVLAAQSTRNLYLGNFGFSGGASIGLDYYINQWWGISLEYTVKYNGVPLPPRTPPLFENVRNAAKNYVENMGYDGSIVDDMQRDYSMIPRVDPYRYFTSAITLSLKTTF